VDGPVNEIRITFSERLAPESTLTLSAGFFQAVPDVVTVVEDDTLRATPALPLAEGVYTVQWKAVTEDGGVTEGSYQFRVGQAAGMPLWVWGLAAIVGIALLGVVFRRYVRPRPTS